MKSILIVGGGFAGFWAAVAAKRVVGNAAEVALVSREPVLQIRPRLYEADPEALGCDLLAPLGEVAVQFIQGEAIDLNAERRTVILSSGNDLRYDRLVVATGSVMRRPSIVGAVDAFSIDAIDDAIAFDRHLARVAQQVSPVIAVIGAGSTGIELALELRERIERHNPASAPNARIVLVDRNFEVGQELGPGPRPAITAALAAADIETRLGAVVTKLSRASVAFSNGELLKADAVVVCTGMVAAPFTAKVPAPRDALGRIIVDEWLRASDASGIFVAGDACVADTGDGHLTLQSCQHALQLGRLAGENAGRDLLGQPLLPYRQLDYVTCLDLGRSGAIFTRGWERTPALIGAEAKRLKRQINTVRIYPSKGGPDALLAESLPKSTSSDKR